MTRNEIVADALIKAFRDTYTAEAVDEKLEELFDVLQCTLMSQRVKGVHLKIIDELHDRLNEKL
jgi:hypothetical protein